MINKGIKADEIKKVVLNHFGMKPEKVFIKTKKAHLVYIRFIYYYLCRKYTNVSFEAIGEGEWNHATVIAGVKRIESLVSINDYKTKRDLLELDELIEEGLYSYEDYVEMEVRKLRADNMSLRSEINHLKKRGMTTKELKLISSFRELNYEKQEEALSKLEIMLKVQNMSHQPLRAS